MTSKHYHTIQAGSGGSTFEIPCDCCTELRAENERLTHLHNLDHSLADQRETEIERLRAALTEIMAMSEPAGYGERSKAQIRDVARRALDNAKE